VASRVEAVGNLRRGAEQKSMALLNWSRWRSDQRACRTFDPPFAEPFQRPICSESKGTGIRPDVRFGHSDTATPQAATGSLADRLDGLASRRIARPSASGACGVD